jgi:hypothetical protein
MTKSTKTKSANELDASPFDRKRLELNKQLRQQEKKLKLELGKLSTVLFMAGMAFGTYQVVRTLQKANTKPQQPSPTPEQTPTETPTERPVAPPQESKLWQMVKAEMRNWLFVFFKDVVQTLALQYLRQAAQQQGRAPGGKSSSSTSQTAHNAAQATDTTTNPRA